MSSGWDETDRDAFATQLRRDGATEETIASTLAAAERVLDVSGPLRGLLPRHVDQAIERAGWAGASGPEQASLRAAGDALLRFVREDPPRRRVADVVGAGAGDPALELAPEARLARRSARPARRASPPRAIVEPTRGGPPPGKCASCAGALRARVQESLAGSVGAALAVAAIAGWWLRGAIGWPGAIGVGGGLLAAGVLLGGMLASYRCERCARGAAARELAEPQRRALATLRARASVVALVVTIATMASVMTAMSIERSIESAQRG